MRTGVQPTTLLIPGMSFMNAGALLTRYSEQEKNEAKLRAAKDKFEACSKRVNEHLALRNYKRYHNTFFPSFFLYVIGARSSSIVYLL